LWAQSPSPLPSEHIRLYIHWKVLVADHTKLGKVFLAKHAEPHDFDVIITDDQADEKYIRKLKKVCGQVMIAEKT
jgi:DeoR/GlpR family transcriptional regulator of sugar metabolism